MKLETRRNLKASRKQTETRNRKVMQANRGEQEMKMTDTQTGVISQGVL